MRTALSITTLLLSVGGCTTLPDVPIAACGNHVLEPGEECDTSKPGCSPPSAGALGCRFSCAQGATCPGGLTCGSDTICRRATGRHTLTEPIGSAGDFFDLTDVNQDGYPDLVERGAGQITLATNDHTGHFVDYATGAAPAIDFTTNGTGVSIAHPTGERPLAAVVTTTTVGLFDVNPANARLKPLVFPTNLIPPSVGGDFRGGIVRAPFDAADALYYNASNKALEVYTPNYGTDVGTHLASSVDLEKTCGKVIGTPRTTVFTHGHDPSLIVVAVNDQVACVAIVTSSSTFKVVPLEVPPMQMSFTGPMPFIVGKFFPHTNDPTGELFDVAASFDYGGFIAPTLVVWKRLDQFAFASPIMVTGGFDVQVGSNGVAAQFEPNLDHLDDFVTGAGISFNHLSDPPDAGVYPAPDPYGTVDTGLSGQMGQSAFYTFLDAAGDVNRDGLNDLVVTTSGLGTFAICLGDGGGLHFTCQVEQSGLPGIDAVTLADINGDSTTDVVVSSAGRALNVGAPDAGTTPDGGVGSDGSAGAQVGSGIDVVLGHPQALPDSVPISVASYHSRVVGVARSPSATTHIADNLLAALYTDDNVAGISLGQASPQGEFIFGFNTGAVDARLADWTGDGVPDLAILDIGGAFTLFTATGRGSFTSNKGQTLVTLGAFNYFRFADVPGDSLPVALWYGQDMNMKDVLTVAHYNVATKMYVPMDAPVPQDTMNPFVPDFVATVDLDRDGGNEVVILSTRTGMSADLGFDTEVLVGRFNNGTAPPQLTVAARVTNFLGIGSNPGFADVNGDGLLDLLLPAWTPDRQQGMQVLLARSDGTFDGAHPIAAPAPFSNDLVWIASADLNGDGITDELFNSPRGAVVALADVERR